MASDGILIRFKSAIDDFLAGKNRVKEELGDLEQSLDSVSDASSDQSQDTRRDLERVADSAGNTADATDEISDSLEQVGETARDAGRDATDSIDEVGGSAEDTAGKVGDIGSAAQDALEGDFGAAAATAITSLGQVALAAGGIGGTVAGGAGLLGDLVRTVFDDMQERSDKLRERVAENFRIMVEDATTSFSVMRYSERLQEIFSDPDLKAEIQKAADFLEIPFETAAAAYAGNQEKIEEFKQAYGEATEYIQGASIEANNAQLAAVNSITQSIRDQIDGIETSAELYDEYLTTLDRTVGAAEAVGALGGALRDLPAEIRIAIALDEPDVDSVFAGLQARANRKLLKIPTTATWVGAGSQFGRDLP